RHSCLQIQAYWRIFSCFLFVLQFAFIRVHSRLSLLSANILRESVAEFLGATLLHCVLCAICGGKLLLFPEPKKRDHALFSMVSQSGSQRYRLLPTPFVLGRYGFSSAKPMVADRSYCDCRL